MEKQNVALVAGATGLVGEALISLLLKPGTPCGPWKVYGVARRPRPDWMWQEAEYVQCDLLSRDTTLAKLSALTDVTHLFWVTWVPRSIEAESCADNGQMLRNVVDSLLPNAKDFKHIGLETGGKHYLGSVESMEKEGGFEFQLNPFTEDLPRLPSANFYYTLEDVVFEVAKKKQGKLTWTVHRPGLTFGVASGNGMNVLGSLAVYAAICKHEGLPFVFPGVQKAWDDLRDASNGDLIAEQMLWAVTDPRGKNQAFNTSNGDVFKWKNVWKPLSEKLGVEYVPYDGQQRALLVTMKDMGPVWDKIVEENGLIPTKIEAVGHWYFVDRVLRGPLGDVLLSMNKSKEHGFLGFRNTEKTFPSIIDKMRERKFIP